MNIPCKICSVYKECRTKGVCLWPRSGSPPPPDSTVVLKGQFRWFGGVLYQLGDWIQHKESKGIPVGIRPVWFLVECEGEEIHEH